MKLTKRRVNRRKSQGLKYKKSKGSNKSKKCRTFKRYSKKTKGGMIAAARRAARYVGLSRPIVELIKAKCLELQLGNIHGSITNQTSGPELTQLIDDLLNVSKSGETVVNQNKQQINDALIADPEFMLCINQLLQHCGPRTSYGNIYNVFSSIINDIIYLLNNKYDEITNVVSISPKLSSFNTSKIEELLQDSINQELVLNECIVSPIKDYDEAKFILTKPDERAINYNSIFSNKIKMISLHFSSLENTISKILENIYLKYLQTIQSNRPNENQSKEKAMAFGIKHFIDPRNVDVNNIKRSGISPKLPKKIIHNYGIAKSNLKMYKRKENELKIDEGNDETNDVDDDEISSTNPDFSEEYAMQDP